MFANPKSATDRRRPLRKRLMLAAGTAVLALAVIEAALWLFWPLPPVPVERMHRYLPSWTAIGPAPRSLRMDPGPLCGVTPGAVDIVFNSYGFLYPEERHRRAGADEVRIAVVGGSTVECCMLPPEKRWSAVLENALHAELRCPVTVLNLGISAQDTRTHLATTSHIVTDLDVDVCVFMLGTNDLGIATSTTHPMLQHDAFHPPPRWSRLVKEQLRKTQLSRHLQRLRTTLLQTQPYFAEAAAFQASLPPRPEDVSVTATGLAHYERNVVSLAGICHAHGIAVLFATQPYMFPDDPTQEQLSAYWGCHTGDHAISPGNFVALLRTVNQRLQQTCAKHGFPCVDLADAVPRGLDHFYDQVHFNEAGARRVAAVLVEPVKALVR